MSKVLIKLKRVEQSHLECELACAKSAIDYLTGKDNDLKELEAEISPPGCQRFWDWDFLTGTAAIKRGLKATVFTNNTKLFHPSWFDPKKNLLEFVEKSANAVKNDKTEYEVKPYRLAALKAAASFIRAGGRVEFLNRNSRFKSITSELIKSQLVAGNLVIIPVEVVLFYGSPWRRGFEEMTEDNLSGHPFGHVVVINGFDDDNFYLTDPSRWPIESTTQEHLIGSFDTRTRMILSIGR
ncbi:hypothetical protein HY546_01910 [archaeon]|nr:hypothetical protein [archaeon]